MLKVQDLTIRFGGLTAVDNLTFEIEKGRLSFRLTAPYSEERRKAASERARVGGINSRVKKSVQSSH